MNTSDTRIYVLDRANNKLLVNALTYFTLISSGKSYIFYTLGENVAINGKNLIKIYVAETNNATGYAFLPISSEEWTNLKQIMSSLGKSTDMLPTTSIQLLHITPNATYNIGEFKKIAINENVKNNITTNQNKYQPSLESTQKPLMGTQFFDPSLKSDTPAFVSTSPRVPNVFEMQTTTQNMQGNYLIPGAQQQVNNQQAPVVTQQPVQNLIQQVPQNLVNNNQIMTQQSPIVQNVIPASQTPVPQNLGVSNISTSNSSEQDVKEALDKILNYFNIDKNKLISLLNNTKQENKIVQTENNQIMQTQNISQTVQEPIVPQVTPQSVVPINIPNITLNQTEKNNINNSNLNQSNEKPEQQIARPQNFVNNQVNQQKQQNNNVLDTSQFLPQEGVVLPTGQNYGEVSMPMNGLTPNTINPYMDSNNQTTN